MFRISSQVGKRLAASVDIVRKQHGHETVFPEVGTPRGAGRPFHFHVHIVRVPPDKDGDDGDGRVDPAAVLGLNRGILQKGMPADINVFHLDKLQIHADFQNPDQYCTGFDYVLVGGEIAVEKDQYRNSKSGVLQRRSGN